MVMEEPDVEDRQTTLLAPWDQALEQEDETDSLYAGSIAGTDTTSLKSSVARYREELGRTFHSYGSTEHWGPNDERSRDQQDLSHQLWMLSLKGQYFLSPISNPEKILDLGTGTGIWAIEVAEQFPQATITGTDLSPIQPTWVPPNCFFEIDDYNVEWLDEGKYDFVHARELLGSCPDWSDLYRKAYKALKPGGWFEQQEPSLFFYSDQLPPDDTEHPYRQWGNMMVEAGTKAGMRFDIGDQIKSRMEDAGFVNVTEYRMPWLIGGWCKDPHLKEVGQWNQVRIDMGVADFCARRMHNQMGMRPEEIELFCHQLRQAFRDKKLMAYQWAWFTYGQKSER